MRKEQKRLEEILVKLHAREEFSERTERLLFMIQVLYANREFVRALVRNYNAPEPIVSTTLARCIFELHMATRDALSSSEKFWEFTSKVIASYRIFLERLWDVAMLGGRFAAAPFENELVKMELLRKKYSIPDVRKPIINFKELADKFGMTRNYEFDYALLSQFIHPSLLYLAVVPKTFKMRTAGRGSGKKWSTPQREFVKTLCLIVANDFSARTLKLVRDSSKQTQLRAFANRKVGDLKDLSEIWRLSWGLRKPSIP